VSNLRRTLITATAGLAALGIATSVALAQGGMMGQGQGMGFGMMGPGIQQMPGQGVSPGMGPQMPGMQQMPGMPGQGMGPGMMGPGIQQMPGMPGQGMGSGMMGPGGMHGMMGQGMPGMMGPGMGGQGMMGGQGPGMRVTPSEHLTTDDVTHFLGHFLERHGNPRLKVGDVQEVDEDTIVAEIVTVDDSLVQRWRVDRHTGQLVPDSTEQAQPAN
jgi:hypothetical protein